MVEHLPWTGDHPYFLLINSLEPNEGGAFGYVVVDLDLKDWQIEFKDWLERSAEWYLCEKGTERTVLAQIVYRGEHPYCIRRHVGEIKLNSGAGRGIVVYGIGKRVPAVRNGRKVIRPERTDRLWILPGGLVCGGEDMERLARAAIEALEWSDQPPNITTVIDGEAVEVT